MRLIDADELRTRCTRKVEPSNNSDFIKAPTWNDAMSIIDDMPAVDPVKHGRWVYYEDETIEDGGRCSVCQCDQPVFWEDWKWKFVETAYCPNCGAMMDEEE